MHNIIAPTYSKPISAQMINLIYRIYHIYMATQGYNIRGVGGPFYDSVAQYTLSSFHKISKVLNILRYHNLIEQFLPHLQTLRDAI